MDNCFYDREGSKLFPFYWMKHPARFEAMDVSKLPAEDREVVDLLDQLLKGLPIRGLLDIFDSSNFELTSLGLMAGHDLDVTAMLANRAKATRASGKVPPARSALKILREKPSNVLVPLPDAKKKTGTARMRPADQNVESDRPSSSTKRQKQPTLEQSGCGAFAIPAVVAGSNFLVPSVQTENLVSLDLTSGGGLQYLEGMSAGAEYKLFCELDARTSLITKHVMMRSAVSKERLQGRLKEADAMLKEVLSANAKATESAEELKRAADAHRWEADDLKLTVQKMKAEAATAAGEIARVNEAAAKFKAEATEKILDQHDAGFQHAIRQAFYFCEVPTNFNFDVSRDFYGCKFISYAEFPQGAQPNEEAPRRGISTQTAAPSAREEEPIIDVVGDGNPED
ncbi:uncharacterized protein LOC114916677 [Cajanus cajan]|uniref:uncharacterized protein LOC114916677 n=1 Tax=Cajanus cajan TaxID=3821 RepID=UPI0010FB5D01|nr:uncharacterized protein LOC114916677 [Cajanus cajan]